MLVKLTLCRQSPHVTTTKFSLLFIFESLISIYNLNIFLSYYEKLDAEYVIQRKEALFIQKCIQILFLFYFLLPEKVHYILLN